MISIFFDLETSTTEPIGQILNYSFIATDDKFEIIDECSDSVKISPLELPVADAILANRIDVIEHQKHNYLNETLSMKKIFDFFTKMIEKNKGEKIILIGYNSLKFDVPYLRTSMIRNGLSPYFRGKIIYRDLLHLVRKLSCVRTDFIRTSKCDVKDDNSKEKNKLSLTLETTCQNYNVLLGKQTHESRNDVILTINLAKKLQEVFNADIRDYGGYELTYSEHIEYKNTKKIFTPIFPQYDLSNARIYENRNYVLLDFSDKYSLWVDLEKYENYLKKIENNEIQIGDLKAKKKVISWYSFAASSLYKPNINQQKEIIIDDNYNNLALKALDDLKDINLKNYFDISVCDIEQDIYRLDFNSLDNLHKIIWENDNCVSKENRSKNLNIVLSRWKLKNIDWDSIDFNNKQNEDKIKFLNMYSEYRYGGKNKLLLNKFSNFDSLDNNDFHKSYKELIDRIKDLKIEKKENREDVELLDSLYKFYKESYISKVL
ncbi:MAG: hypothetical protein SPJ04_06420 [Bdellovibrionota bacterium]|nr:hypothetical protein [Bdellovibrionota bacterium]